MQKLNRKLLNLDRYFFLFSFLYLGKCYLQHTLVKCRLNLVGLHVDREPKGTLERLVASLNAMIMFVFLFLLFFTLNDQLGKSVGKSGVRP